MNEMLGGGRGGFGRVPREIPGREEIEVDVPAVSDDHTTRLHGELFGIPQVEARTYHCGTCDLAILAQEVVWDEDDNPRCPHCGSPLGAAE